MTQGAHDEFIVGIHAVQAALRQDPSHIDGVWIDAQREDARIAALIGAARAAKVKIHRAPKSRLDEWAGELRHQGVVARLRAVTVASEDDLLPWIEAQTQPFVLILDGVQDPHNLGACLRSADAAGVHAVIVPRDAAAPVNATVRRVACGAAESVKIFQVTNLARCLDQLRAAGVWLVGAAADAPQPLYQLDLRGPLGLVLGGEEKGLRRLTRERCDFLAHLPMAGRVESLNVSVAAGIFLFEAVRQRRVAPVGARQ